MIVNQETNNLCRTMFLLSTTYVDTKEGTGARNLRSDPSLALNNAVLVLRGSECHFWIAIPSSFWLQNHLGNRFLAVNPSVLVLRGSKCHFLIPILASFCLENHIGNRFLAVNSSVLVLRSSNCHFWIAILASFWLQNRITHCFACIFESKLRLKSFIQNSRKGWLYLCTFE